MSDAPQPTTTAGTKPSAPLWRWLGWTVLALLFLLVGLLVWALGTNSGARTLVGQALPANITVSEVQGRFWGPLSLLGVRVEDPSAVVEIAQLSLAWRPHALLSKTVQVTQLKLQGILVQILPTTANVPVEPSEPFVLPFELATPVDLVIEELLLVDVQVQQAQANYAMDRARLQASWLDTQLTLHSFEVVAGAAKVALQGGVQLSGDYPLDMTAAIKALDPSAIEPSLPQVRLNATAQAQGPMLDPQALVELIALLPDQPEPINVRLEGGASAYRFLAQSRWHQGNNILPIELQGTGSAEAVQLQRLQVGVEQAPEMQLSLSGDMRWVDGLNGAFVLAGTGVNPAIFADELASDAGSIPNGNLQLGAHIDVSTAADDKLSVAVDELLVDGTLGTLPVTLDGTAKWSPEHIQIDRLQGRLGAKRVHWQVQGAIAQRNNLTWSLEATGLEEVSEALGLAPKDRVRGQVKGSGYIRGTQQDPKVLAELEGGNLVYQDQRLDSFAVHLMGDKRSHALTLALSAPELKADLALTGHLRADSRWQFLASQLDVAATVADQAQIWQLRDPVKGWFQEGQFELQPMCLTQSAPSSNSALCVSASNPNERILADVQLSGFDLQLLNSMLPPQVRLRGLVGGTAHWGGEPMLSRGDLQLEGLAVAVQNTERWQDALVFNQGQLTLAPQGDDLALRLDLPLQAEGAEGSEGLQLESRISGSALRSPDLSPDLWPVQGQLTMQLPEMAWVGSFSPEVEVTDAGLTADLAIGGLLGEPSLNGEAQLQVASLLLNTPDIRLEQTKLQLKGTNTGLALRGTTTTSNEPVQLAVDLSWLQGMQALQASGSLVGNNLLVSDSTTALVRVSPDLRVNYSDNLVKVRGRVTVPTADIRLRQAPSGAITVTSDQVLIETVEAEEAELPVAVDARLDVVLGDDVRFAGLGLQAQFSGKLNIQQEPDRLARGTGEINITQGSYTAYGQDLTIERGRVIFAGGQLTEPGLDVRAVRQATPEVAVGVDVRGSLADPRLTLFSTPALPESDQLSYLVLGRPMSGGSASERSVLQQAALALGVKGGKLITDRLSQSLAVDNIGIESAPGEDNDQAALVIGKYLSPKLYVSYGYGLFEPISTLRLEYQLSRLWRIVTESTNQAAGGDFEWVLEK